jgi:membrane protein DedA with SNARE-associated domain
MTLSSLFAHYGYLVLLLGSLGDGTPVMLFGGFAAHRGWLVLTPSVILAGAAGNFVAWSLWFFGVRALGAKVLEKRPDWAKPVAAMQSRLERWEVPTIVGARFIPGLGTTAVIASALSGISPGRFLIWNAAGSVLWAAVYGCLGYLLGHSIQLLLGHIERYEEPVAAALLVAGLVWIAYHQWRHWQRRPVTGAAPATVR